MAMVILNIGIFALMATFQSGSMALKRAAVTSNGAAVGDKVMEAYRGLENKAIYLNGPASTGSDDASGMPNGIPNSSSTWYAAYHDNGLVIVGVHTPEFAFEHVTSNVQSAVKRLGVTWPVVQDNRYKTWDNFANQYWPAEYLIDRAGHVRHTHFGEGEYGQTEALIRTLLGAHGRTARHVADATPSGLLTPETYLGYARLNTYVGSKLVQDVTAPYTFAKRVPQNELSYGGDWRGKSDRIVAGMNARLRLNFTASNVYIVLGGRGTVHALIDGKPTRAIKVDAQRLYTVLTSKRSTDGLLELRFSRGIQAYSFTFG